MQQHEPGSGSRMWRNVAAEAAARVTYLVTRFFIPPFVLSRVGIEAYGLYGTVFMLVAYFGISALGFSNAYIKYVAELAAAGKKDQANRLLSTGMTLMSAVGAAGFGTFALCWPALARYLRVPPVLSADGRLLALMIVGIFFVCLALSVYRDALTGLQQIGVVQKIWTGSFILETVLIFAFVAGGLGLPGMGLAFAARSVFDLTGNWYVARKRIPWLRVRLTCPDRESVRALARFGCIVQINSLLSVLLNSLERVAAAPLLGLGACGVLDIGKRFPAMAASIPSSFASSMLPSAAELHARTGDWSGLSRLYLSTSRYMSLVSGSLFAYLCFFALPALRFWLGDVPAGAVVVTVLFSVSSQIHMLTGPGTSVVKAAGKPHFEFHYTLANLAAAAILLYASRFVSGGWSVTSIAASMALATIMSAAWFLARLHRRMSISMAAFARGVLFPGVLLYVAAAVVWLALPNMPYHSRWEAAMVLAASGSAYFTLLVAATAIFTADRQEWAVLRQWAVRVAARLFPSPAVVKTNP